MQMSWQCLLAHPCLDAGKHSLEALIWTIVRADILRTETEDGYLDPPRPTSYGCRSSIRETLSVRCSL